MNMSRVAAKQASDQSPAPSMTKLQNGPQKLHASLQQSPAAAQLKPLGSKSMGLMTELKEYEDEFYAKDMRQCRLCSRSFKLLEIFQHYETDHSVCFCVYCGGSFESRFVLTSHLESAHNVTNQMYRNMKEFSSKLDKGVDLLCIHCKKVFPSDSSLVQAMKHECDTNFSRCRHCNFPWANTKIAEHEQVCRSKFARTLSNLSEKGEVTLTPLRSRHRPCKKCLQVISPARLAQHIRECNGVPTTSRRSSLMPSKGQESTDRVIRCVKCKSSVMLSKFQDHKKVCPGHAVSGAPRAEAPMERQSKEIVPLDPLLVEQDPEIRLNMLISALVDHIRVENKKYHRHQYDGGEPPVVTVSLPTEFKDKPVNYLLQELILKGSETCLYCRQAILIRVDKRQLALHLFINHRFKIQVTQQGSSDEGKPQPVEPTETKTEVAEVMQELVTKSELLTDSDAEAAAAVSEPQKPEDKTAVTYPDTQVDSKTQETDQTSQPTTQGHSNENRELALITNPVPPASMSPAAPVETVNWHEFEMMILQQIFHSTDVLFCFDRGDNVFGRMPCDCLLCGQRISSQLKLFAHWRVAHKGVAMRCAMCTGRFLFSGSLFSHHCFGTPRLFEEVRQAAIAEASVSEESNRNMQVYADGETSNSTMVLRYQCEFCGIQLPGFFNYMVHLRKVHNTCELCLETVEDQKFLERHHRKHKLQHYCWKCAIPYLAKPNYMTHLFWKHGAESKTCYSCLEKKWPFIYHFCLPPTIFSCEICKIQFTKPVCLIVHRRLHSNDKLRKCPSCMERFISKKILNKHIEANHKVTKAILAKAEGTETPTTLPATVTDIKAEEQQSTPTPMAIEKAEDVKDLKEEIPEVPKQDLQKDKKTDEPDSQESAEKVLEPKADPGENVVGPITDDASDKANDPNPELKLNAETEAAAETGQPIVVGDGETTQSPRKRKSKKNRNYSVKSLHGPNLSEEESDGDEEDDGENDSQLGENPAQEFNESLAHINLPVPADETFATSSPLTTPPVTDTSAMAKLPTSTPLLVVEESKPKHVGEPAVNQTRMDTTEHMKEHSLEQTGSEEPKVYATLQPLEPFSVPSYDSIMTKSASTMSANTSMDTTTSVNTSMDTTMSANTSIDTTISMDTPDTAEDSEKPEDDLQEAMSPLLPPLDKDFPDVPTLDDGVSTQQHILQCVSLDHDYCRAPTKEMMDAEKRKMSSEGASKYDAPHSHRPVKRLKIAKIRSPKKHKDRADKGMKRKRHNSSSSSSSSSSCSSCSTNCSCSGSSSSDDESHAHEKTKKTKVVLKKLKKIPLKKPKVVKDPTIPKRPVGRPPKYPKDGSRPPPPKPKAVARQSAEQRQEEMLKHFKNKEDAYIPESDLDTDLSDSDTHFDKKQQEEVIGKVPQVFEQVWEQKSEEFLLPIVKGVKSYDELRHRGKPRAVQPTEKNREAARPAHKLSARPMIANNNSYKVVTKPEANGKQARLKLRNVPLKKLYLVNTAANNAKPIPPSTSKAVISLRPPVLKSGFSQNKALNFEQPTPLQLGAMQMKKKLLAAGNRWHGDGLDMEAQNSMGNGRVGMGRNKFSMHDPNPHFMVGDQGVNRRPMARDSFTSSHMPNATGVTIRHSTTITPIPPPAQEVEPPNTMEDVPVVETATAVVDSAIAASSVAEAPSTAEPMPEPVVVAVAEQVQHAENNGEESKPKNLYCYCQSDDGDSDMIACDGAKCKHEWFHFRCVGVKVAPKGKWYCPDCRPAVKGRKSAAAARPPVENRHKPTRNGIDVETIKGATAAAPAAVTPGVTAPVAVSPGAAEEGLSGDNKNTLEAQLINQL